MAPRNQLDPDYSYPFSYRLAQFLLNASDSLGTYGQGLADTSKMATLDIEQEEKSADRRDLLTERRREADLKAEERGWARQDRLGKAAIEAGRREAFGQLARVPTVQEENFITREEFAPATERGAPNLEVGTPLPIFQELAKMARPTTLQEALGKVDPSVRQHLTSEDIARYAKMYPETPPLDPAKAAQAYKDIASSGVKDKEALARFVFGGQAPSGIGFESPTVKGSERKAQLEADVLEGLPPDKRAVAAYPSLKDSGGGERNPFAGLDPTKLDAIVATPDSVLEGTDLARQFGGAAGLKAMAKDALARIEGRTTRQAAGTAAAVERAKMSVPNVPPEAQQTKRLGLIEAEGILGDLTALTPKVNLARIAGGIQPWINDILQKGRIGPLPVDPANFGGQLSSDELQFLALLEDYSDRIFRQRTGAASAEPEFKRMLGFLASAQVRPEVVVERLNLQKNLTARARRQLEDQWKELNFIVPKSTPPSATLGGGPITYPPGFRLEK